MRAITLITLGLILCQSAFAQEQKYVTEEYLIPRQKCKVYAYELEDFLKSKGLYDGQKTNYHGKGKVGVMKKKVHIGGIDFTKDCTFVIELLGDRLPKDENPYEFRGSFGIIEIGFQSKGKAQEVYKQAVATSKKYTMNIPIYAPPFRCISIGKSVLFVYSINVDMDKYRDMALSFKLDDNNNIN